MSETQTGSKPKMLFSYRRLLHRFLKAHNQRRLIWLLQQEVRQTPPHTAGIQKVQKLTPTSHTASRRLVLNPRSIPQLFAEEIQMDVRPTSRNEPIYTNLLAQLINLTKLQTLTGLQSWSSTYSSLSTARRSSTGLAHAHTSSPKAKSLPHGTNPHDGLRGRPQLRVGEVTLIYAPRSEI